MRSPKKPTAQKKLEGTNRKSRENKAEPQFEARLPEPPDCLGADALEEWHRLGPLLHAQRVISEADRGILAACCISWGIVVWLTRKLNAGELFLLDEEGYARKYPVDAALFAAMVRYEAQCGSLGCSPASRAKVSRIGEPEKTDPLEKLLAKRKAREQAREGDRPN